MTGREIHLERIAPGRAPGGVVVRVCTLERLLTEYAATDPELVSASASADGDLALEALAKNETVWTYFYDGDSGECMRTLITKPKGTSNE